MHLRSSTWFVSILNCRHKLWHHNLKKGLCISSVCFSYALPIILNPQPPFHPQMKKRMKKKKQQQQPLLPVKLLVAPLTALTGESKAIKMTRRQIMCDTSKGLEKAGKLSSATSSSTLRRGREEKKKTQSRQARAAWSTQAPRDSRALLSASPQTQTQTRPPRLHVQWLHYSRSRAQRG